MRSVLLIDDDAMSRDLFSVLLEGEGYAVRTCENGDAALAALRTGKSRPDAILSDMQMSGTTGTALAEALRALCPRSVIIGMSASKPSGGQLKGFDAFLLKPFDGAQFTKALGSLNSGTPAETAPAGKSQVSDLDEAVVAPLAAAMPSGQLGALYALSLSDTRKRVAAMRQSLAAGNDGAFRGEAHAIKGGAVMLGASAVAELARQMEEAGISADAPGLLDDLIAAITRLEGILLLTLPRHTTSSTETP
ncbi:MAG TPA: response regulator [Acidobacteriaceae bacterium]|nr:response regulator [Acidobacteriaceae bacterium]